MGETRERILIGDENQQRMEWLRPLFEEEFSGIDLMHCQTFQEVFRQASAEAWELIMISRKLPKAPDDSNFILDFYFTELTKLSESTEPSEPSKSSRNLIGLYGEDGKPVLPEPLRHHNLLYVPAIEVSVPHRRKLISEFRKSLNWSPLLPDVDLGNDPLLDEQVRSLSGDRKLDDGKELLAQFVRSFFKCKKVTVTRIGQGKSGSRVFRIRPEPSPTDYSEFVIKLIPQSDWWKIAHEVEGHKKAKTTLSRPPLISHVTELCETCSPHPHQSPDFFNHVAALTSKGWYAICYVFLGGSDLGRFTDLETTLIAEPKASPEKVSIRERTELPTPETIRQNRLALLEKVLQWLGDQWYMNSEREPKHLWETPNAQDNQYSPLPPYRFTGRAKEHIIAFLDGFDAQLGRRFPMPSASPSWDERLALIRGLLSKDQGPTGFSKLDDPLEVLLTPTHGDLNAANVLLWRKQSDHFFLIDFPFYQERGHLLQDFARLEVEMKFMLLDRQADSPADKLPAFDYTHSQMALWLELEEHLLNDWTQLKPDDKDWQQHGHKENVISCLELVQLIRRTAKDIYHDAGVADNFLDEYWAALLYHTLRILSYPSISLFKRLMAIYSASSILEKLH